MNITFWVYMRNQGDGSCNAMFFPNRELAEAFAEEDGERFCDDIEPVTIVVDQNGNLMKPLTSVLGDDGFLYRTLNGRPIFKKDWSV